MLRDVCIRSSFTQTFSDVSLACSKSIPSRQMKEKGEEIPNPSSSGSPSPMVYKGLPAARHEPPYVPSADAGRLFKSPSPVPIAVSTAAADIKFPPPVKAVPDRFHPPPRPVGAGPEMLERHGEHGTAPGQHKGRAQAAELRKNDILMHQTEVASLLSHQRRCREAEQRDRDLAREGALHLREGARNNHVIGKLESSETESAICKRASIEERP